MAFASSNNRISVIIPTYNRASLIASAIDSVLAQTRPPDELIVVDDGSSDDTQSAVASYGDAVRYVRKENGGESSARNLGILRATGDYVLFLDSDDLLVPEALEKLAGALDSNPDRGASYCGWIDTDWSGESELGRSDLDKPSGSILREMCLRHLCVVHSVMVRRRCFSKAGLFDTMLTNFIDIDLWIRVAEHYPFVFVPDHLAIYRQNPAGASKQYDRVRLAGTLMLTRLARYRSGALSARGDWAKVRYRFLGVRGRELTRRAFSAYARKDFAESFGRGVRALLHDPPIRRNWGMWAMVFRSLPGARRAGGSEL